MFAQEERNAIRVRFESTGNNSGKRKLIPTVHDMKQDQSMRVVINPHKLNHMSGYVPAYLNPEGVRNLKYDLSHASQVDYYRGNQRFVSVTREFVPQRSVEGNVIFLGSRLRVRRIHDAEH